MMAWTASVVSLVVIGSGLIAIGVGGLVLRERPDPLARPLALLMFGVTAWAIPHAVALGFTDLGAVAFWSRVQYPGIVIAPVAYLVVALRYAGHDEWLSGRTYIALAIVPAITTVIAWTNPVHGLLWEEVAMARTWNASVFTPVYGPWYWVNLGYLYLVTLVGLFLFGKVIVDAGRIYRKQAGLMFFGALVPLVTNMANTLGVPAEPAIDLTTVALTITGVTFALVLFRFDLIDVRPIARDRLIEELDDGVVVVGPDGRIRDFNPTAETVLGDIEIERDAEEVLSSAVTPNGGEILARTDGDERRFRARSTALRDESGRGAGRIVYLNDVTEIVEREQRIGVLNRILRHNVRNELNVAAGRLELAAEETSGPTAEHVERAIESTERVIELAEKARDVERTLTESGRSVAVDVPDCLERVANRARDRFTAADIEVDVASRGAPEARVVDGDLFERAIEELIENAVVHSDREAPHVVVRVRDDSDRVSVSVVDDGPGIPDHETAVLSAGRETQLEHASGLGLWLVRWTASLSSGELSFEANDPDGSVVTLRLLRTGDGSG